jgi:hypothetical protein
LSFEFSWKTSPKQSTKAANPEADEANPEAVGKLFLEDILRKSY